MQYFNFLQVQVAHDSSLRISGGVLIGDLGGSGGTEDKGPRL